MTNYVQLRRLLIRITVIINVFFFLPAYLIAQKKIDLHLADLQSKNKLEVINRDISVVNDGSKQYIKVEKQLEPGKIPGKDEEGIIWLPVDDFSDGKIEMVVRGKDLLQGSFAGIAFHAADDSTYDNVYCRPFNFITSDSVRRIHAIQYVSMPTYPWYKLRAEQNGIYEKAITNAPGPNDWFILTVAIKGETVKAYINHSETASLTVKKLNQRTKGKIGITGINFDVEKIIIQYN